ncbi:isoform 2 of ankyrin repeat domain-containing protein 50 [Aspergillus udagawae]|uniref:Isoform 2 of ankyrin repeat domain-containing protein 50 n=1 Tax=Aspergillus udagawae TaxID=91492 RepID=A0A8H3NDD4_9EURO|nr:isoform 2 of ankyrin repeat domain-containing protein 50 [Aspergillus udagawae]
MDDSRDIKLQTALQKACDTGNTYMAKVLLQQGASANIRDSSGRAPLHVASFRGIKNLVEVLLQSGANVDLRDNDGQTPLHITSNLGDNIEVAELLLQNGADVDMRDNDGKTALHKASVKGMEGMANLLLRHQAHVNFRDNFGCAPLHLAVNEMKAEVLKVLLEHGANVNMKDPNGKAALHLLGPAARTDVLELLLQHGADINLKDADGNTALHLACVYGWKDVAELLLQHEADIHIRDSNGMTAVQLANLRGSKEIADLFLRPGATAEPIKDESQSQYAKSKVGIDAEELATGHPPEGDSQVAGPEICDKGSMSADLKYNARDGVRRDNGDGFILATHDDEDVHSIQLKLNFMKSISTNHRIRYAKVDVRLREGPSGDSPHIRTIMPQADRVEVSEQEITSGQKFTVGASGNGGPSSSVNISMEGSKGKRSTFKGVRIIHGAVKDRMHASWRLYEEPGSKSGLPEIVRLLMVVQCQGEFDIRLSLSIKACHFFTFGIPRMLTAGQGPAYLVPNLSVISAFEQSSKLQQMLDAANRAAAVVEEAKKLETAFAQAIKDHKKRALIMEAGVKESYLQEWTDIVDASKSSDFRILREKLLRMGDVERGQQMHPAQEPGPDEKFTQIEQPRRGKSPQPKPEPPVNVQTQTRRMQDRFTEKDLGRTILASMPASKNVVASFSAVGPGYTTSRLA